MIGRGNTAMRGRPARERDRIIAYASILSANHGWVNKSKIARDMKVHIRTVFRVLRKNPAERIMPYAAP